jgi:hypothetical protein
VGSFDERLAAIRARLGPSATPDETMAVLNEIAWSDPALAIDLADALGQTEEEKTAWVADLARWWAGRQGTGYRPSRRAGWWTWPPAPCPTW